MKASPSGSEKKFQGFYVDNPALKKAWPSTPFDGSNPLEIAGWLVEMPDSLKIPL